ELRAKGLEPMAAPAGFDDGLLQVQRDETASSIALRRTTDNRPRVAAAKGDEVWHQMPNLSDLLDLAGKAAFDHEESASNRYVGVLLLTHFGLLFDRRTAVPAGTLRDVLAINAGILSELLRSREVQQRV